jgi:hypothetical protein
MYMIIKVYNDLETKLLSKIVGDDREQIKDEYSTDGTLYMRHHIKNNIVNESHKYNKFGDIISHGSYVNGNLHGAGCSYDHVNHQWIKSPHFQNGKVFGLAAVFDVNHEIIFYGWMFDSAMKKEEHIYHPFLIEEYKAVQKYEHNDKIMMKQIYDLLDCQENVVPVEL